MPTKPIKRKGKIIGYKWGNSGTIYRLSKYGVVGAKSMASKQGAAVYASGWKKKKMRASKGKRRRPHRHVRKYKSGRKTIVNAYIPPGWKNVKYHTNKKYVATAEDIKGRLQYIYPKDHTKKTSAQKYKRISKLEGRLKIKMPDIIKDAKNGIEEAQIVYAIKKTGFRPGVDVDTKADKKAYGLLTLKKNHILSKRNDQVHFKFPAKKGTIVDKKVKDQLLSNIISDKLTTKRLFHTSYPEVSEYFKSKVGSKYMLKDLRTLKATEIARKSKGTNKEIATRVSEELCNTPAIARSSYIDPKLLGD